MSIYNVEQAQARIALLQAFIDIKSDKDGNASTIVENALENSPADQIHAGSIDVVNVVMDDTENRIVVFARIDDEDTKTFTLYITLVGNELQASR